MSSPVSPLDELRLEVRAVLAEWRQEGVFEPQCDGWCRGFSREVTRRLAERGWVGVTIPTEYGGGGRTGRERYVIAEELLAAGAPVTAHWTAERQIVPMLLEVGTEAQRQRFLPLIARGELTFAIGMSEPGSGSDLASVRTRAVHSDDGWRLSGQKIWSTAAQHADYMVVLCRTDGTSEDRHVGLSQMLVDLRAPGVEIRPIGAMNGEADFCEVFFDDVLIDDEDVVGHLGAGWKQVLAELSFERSGPDRYMSTYPLVERFLAVAPVERPEVATAAGRLLAELVAVRGLSMRVLAAEGGDLAADAALCKDAGTGYEQNSIETVRELVSDCAVDDAVLQALLDDMVLTAPMITLRGGTTEILRGVTARRMSAG
ncbi:MAG TPA: acyl-CoA dehydrogenase family protein [Baekduia sp.]|jgi:alkylation response protein AidB-like acyl-CoA dehydrogenase